MRWRLKKKHHHGGTNRNRKTLVAKTIAKNGCTVSIVDATVLA
jgi:hypothetical protein